MQTAPPGSLQTAPAVQMQAPAMTTTMLVSMNNPMMTAAPTRTTCPTCSNSIVTEPRPKVGMIAIALSVGMFFLGCWCCFFIPLCIDQTKDHEHYCPNCNTMLGLHRAFT